MQGNEWTEKVNSLFEREGRGAEASAVGVGGLVCRVWIAGERPTEQSAPSRFLASLVKGREDRRKSVPMEGRWESEVECGRKHSRAAPGIRSV